MSLHIRPVKPEDSEAITGIYNHYICHSTSTFELRPLSVEEMAERIRHLSATHPYLVAESEDGVIGYCYAHRWREREAYSHTWETTVYVSIHHCGQHVGVELMTRLMEECLRQPECQILIACITEENSASVHMHEKLGFRQVSCFKHVGYKFDRYLNVVDMEYMLRPTDI